MKDEPDDLTHLAPTAGDACIPLDEFSDMFDDFILPENYNSLLNDELNSLDSSSSKLTTSSNCSSNDPFIIYRDESSDVCQSPNLVSPAGFSKVNIAVVQCVLSHVSRQISACRLWVKMSFHIFNSVAMQVNFVLKNVKEKEINVKCESWMTAWHVRMHHTFRSAVNTTWTVSSILETQFLNLLRVVVFTNSHDDFLKLRTN